MQIYVARKLFKSTFSYLGNWTTIEDSKSLAQEFEKNWRLHLAGTISAGIRISAGVTPKNEVVLATRDPFRDKADILSWNNIVSISVCGEIVIGLKSDGTVVIAKRLKDDSYDSHINTDDWSNIVAVSAGQQHIVGLCNDGTVVASSLL